VLGWGAVVIVESIKKKRGIVAKMSDMANELLLSLLNNKRPSETEWIKFQTAFCENKQSKIGAEIKMLFPNLIEDISRSFT